MQYSHQVPLQLWQVVCGAGRAGIAGLLSRRSCCFVCASTFQPIACCTHHALQGFLPNRRQQRMAGLAAIEFAQALQQLVRPFRSLLLLSLLPSIPTPLLRQSPGAPCAPVSTTHCRSTKPCECPHSRHSRPPTAELVGRRRWATLAPLCRRGAAPVAACRAATRTAGATPWTWSCAGGSWPNPTTRCAAAGFGEAGCVSARVVLPAPL